MTTQDLVVDALSATLAGVEPTAAARRWLDETATQLVEEHLPRAVASATLPPGHWFIPRLDLVLSCHDVASLPPLAADWSRAILEALAHSLATDRAWVHFANDVELVAACVVAAVTESRSTEWVWAQTGLLDGAAAALPPAGRVSAALRSYPHAAVAGVLRAAELSSVAMLDRALGEAGWQAVVIAAGADPGHLEPPSPDVAEHLPPQTSPARVAAVEVALASSTLARLLLRSRLRPTPATARAWAWLVVAEAEPARLSTSQAREAVRILAGLLLERLSDAAAGRGRARTDEPAPREEATPDPRPVDDAPSVALRRPEPRPEPLAPLVPGAGEPDPVPGTDLPVQVGATATDAVCSGPQTDDLVLAAGDLGPEAGLPSAWAGLLQLVATATAAGIPDRVLDDPGLGHRGVRWSVWHAAVLLTQADPDDPAVLALAGLPSDRAGSLLDTTPPERGERRGLALLAARWRRVTVARLRSADPEVAAGRQRDVLDWLVHRPGRIVAQPGWIDVVMPLSGVEPSIRVAGLDLDPGCVPWLGTVVRFRYE
jgi:hypothetical protein